MNPTGETTGHIEPLEQIIRRAAAQLQALYTQRTEITRRITEIKKQISSLAALSEDPQLKLRLMQLVDRPASGRQHGLTQACRLALIEASAPMTSTQVAKAIQQSYASVAKYKDPAGVVNTVLNRLVRYGEAQKVVDPDGRLAWEWASRPDMKGAREDIFSVSGANKIT